MARYRFKRYPRAPVRRRMRVKKRRRTRKRRSYIPKGLPLKDMQLAKMTYVATGSHTHNSVGLTVSTRFIINGMFDPEFALGGQQPYQFDQMMANYNKYTVLSAKITVTCTGGSAPAIFGVLALPNVADPNPDPAQLMERPRCRYGFSDKDTSRTISYKVSLKKLFGVSDLIGDDNFFGTTATQPNTRGSLWCWTYSPYIAQDLFMSYRVEFIAAFHGKKYVGRS